MQLSKLCEEFSLDSEKESNAILFLRKRLLFFSCERGYNEVTKALLNLFGRT